MVFAKSQTTYLLLDPPPPPPPPQLVFVKYYGCMSHHVPPLLCRKLGSMRTWHGLVYFIRLLAELLISHRVDLQECQKPREKEKWGGGGGGGEISCPLHTTCLVLRVSRGTGTPHGPGLKRLVPSVQSSVSVPSSAGSKWMKRATSGARSLSPPPRARARALPHLTAEPCARASHVGMNPDQSADTGTTTTDPQ